MDIYFVRHTKTKANAARRHQSLKEEILLNDDRLQLLIGSLRSLHPTHLYMSPLRRTVQTAERIAAATGLPAQSLDLVQEMRYHSSLYNVSHYSITTLRYGIDWFRDAQWIEEDEEAESRWNFFCRFKELQRYLKNGHASSDKVVIVTHSFFIIGFVLHMCRTKPRSLLQMLPYIFTTIRFKNGSITHVRFNKQESRCQWEVVSFDSIEY